MARNPRRRSLALPSTGALYRMAALGILLGASPALPAQASFLPAKVDAARCWRRGGMVLCRVEPPPDPRRLPSAARVVPATGSRASVSAAHVPQWRVENAYLTPATLARGRADVPPLMPPASVYLLPRGPAAPRTWIPCRLPPAMVPGRRVVLPPPDDASLAR